MDKRKKIFVFAAAFTAVIVFSCTAAFFVRHSGTDKKQIVATVDESVIFFNFKDDITAARESENVSCKAVFSDGKAPVFEMRFPLREQIENLLKNSENFYFASVDCGGKLSAVPMDNIKILTNTSSGEYVLTIDPPNKIGGKPAGCLVRFYISSQGTKEGVVLFMAEAECE
ncbi:MAG: hypothetical protein GX107_02950 [Clostridiales bacterium]|jgi:hypothetical protein|nr:hypothetical protein [Clostridiales bacterium]